MDRKAFLSYVNANYSVSGKFIRLLDNVLFPPAHRKMSREELVDELYLILYGVIGITCKEHENVIL